jgi:hypothetical protein
MKICECFALLLCLSIPRMNYATENEATVKLAIQARLEQLQNLRIEYRQTTTYTPPEKLLKKAKTDEKGRSFLIETGTEQSRCTFSFLDGLARYTRILTEKNPVIVPSTPVAKQILVDTVYKADHVERFSVRENDSQPKGAVCSFKSTKLPTDSVEIGLGVRAWSGQTWHTAQSLDKMNIEKVDSNCVILRNIDDKNCTHEWIFDPQLGYALKSYRRLVPPDNHVNIQYDMENFESVNGVMLPRSIKSKVFYAEEGRLKLAEESSCEIEKYAINASDNTPDRYRIEWPDNTIVYDQYLGMSFLYVNGAIQMQKELYLDGAAPPRELLASSLGSKSDKILSFVPKIDAALRLNKSSVYDLATCKLIYVEANVESSKIYNQLLKAEQGDLAWNDTLLTTRDTILYPLAENADKPLEFVSGKWTRSYNFPKEVPLPYEFIAKTRENRRYKIGIYKIDPDGIWILSNMLTDEDGKRHQDTK